VRLFLPLQNTTLPKLRPLYSRPRARRCEPHLSWNALQTSPRVLAGDDSVVTLLDDHGRHLQADGMDSDNGNCVAALELSDPATGELRCRSLLWVLFCMIEAESSMHA